MSDRDFAEDDAEVVDQDQPEGESHEEESEQEAPEAEQEQSEGSEEAPRQKKSKPRNHNPYKTRLNQTQKEKFQAINEAQRLQQENEYLRQQMELSNQTGMYHYEASVDQRLQRAENSQVQAIESGDVRSQVEAQRELADAVAEKRRILESKAQQSIQQQQQQQYYNQIPAQDQGFQVDEYQKNEVARWASRNPYFDQKNPEYDPSLSDAVEAFADRLERTLMSTGREHLVCTREYFNELDRYAQTYYEDNRRPSNQNGRQLNMRPSNQYVASPSRGGMNNSGQQSSSGNTPINGVPAAEIRDMAKRLGITEKQYRQNMLNDKPGNRHGGQR